MKAFIALLMLFSLSLHSEETLKKRKAPKYKYDLSICAIFRDEGPYLKEWIEFHKLVGVQHFVLYNHLSVDNSKEVLQPYLNDRTVELIDLDEEIRSRNHWGSIQRGAYNDGLKRLLGKSKWVAFIDSDEFLIPVKQNNLVAVLKDYEEYAGVCAHWLMYGTSHLPKIPENILQIEALIYRANTKCMENRSVKSIVRPETVSNFPNPHYANYKKGFTQVDENKVPFKGPKKNDVSVNILRINHYYTRDEDYFFNVKVPSRVNRGRPGEEEIVKAALYNDIVDTEMFRFVPALRAKMGY